MSKFPVYFLFVLVAAYLLYIVFFTPAIDKLITRFRLSRKTTAVKELADEVHLAAITHQEYLLKQQLETDMQLDDMAAIRQNLLNAPNPNETEPAPRTPSTDLN